jgi:hypothetical protein
VAQVIRMPALASMRPCVQTSVLEKKKKEKEKEVIYLGFFFLF